MSILTMKHISFLTAVPAYWNTFNPKSVQILYSK